MTPTSDHDRFQRPDVKDDRTSLAAQVELTICIAIRLLASVICRDHSTSQKSDRGTGLVNELRKEGLFRST